MRKEALFPLSLLLIFAVSACVIPLNAATSYDIYAGESKSHAGQVGFGMNDTNYTVPGPTLILTEGETVTVTLHNIGYGDHNWVITDNTSTVIWGAQIGSAENPIESLSNGSVTFTVGRPGTYRYESQCSNLAMPDSLMGMYGTVVVKPTIPEFPAAILVAFVAIALTAFALFQKRHAR